MNEHIRKAGVPPPTRSAVCPHCGGPLTGRFRDNRMAPVVLPTQPGWPFPARALAWVLLLIVLAPFFLIALYYSLYLLAPLLPR